MHTSCFSKKEKKPDHQDDYNTSGKLWTEQQGGVEEMASA